METTLGRTAGILGTDPTWLVMWCTLVQPSLHTIVIAIQHTGAAWIFFYHFTHFLHNLQQKKDDNVYATSNFKFII